MNFSSAIDAYRATLALSKHTETTTLATSLRALVKIRVSQLNACAFCIDMHWKEARAAGESEARLYGLDAWRETPGYTEEEQAALAWGEAVTRLDEGHVDDAVYQRARAAFSEKDLMELTYVIVVMNTWNRLCIATRLPPAAPLPKL